MTIRKASGLAGLLVFGLIFGGVGYALAFHWGGPLIAKAEDSALWPVVAGTIESAEIVSSTDGDGDTMYEADVVFVYEIGGRVYRSADVQVGGQVRSSSRRLALHVVNRYRAGDAVSVHYNPDDPGEAVLEPGKSAGGQLVFWIGIAFLGFGLFIIATPLAKLAVAGAAIGAAASAARG